MISKLICQNIKSFKKFNYEKLGFFPMTMSLFLSKSFAEEQMRHAEIPVSEFAVGKIAPSGDPSRYMYNRKKKYDELSDCDFYNSVDQIAQADAILMPVDFSYATKKAPNILNHFLSLSEESGKPLIISSLGDTTADVPGKNTIVLRTSKFRWSAKTNEIFCPPVVDDRLSGKKVSLINVKTERPTVGFVGQSIKPEGRAFLRNRLQFGYRDYIKTAVSPFSSHWAVQRSGFYFRGKALGHLAADMKIDTDFIQRNYWGLETRHAADQLRMQEEEYDTNIKNNLFTLCVRGAGNFSLRLYEVLSSARIPILIDTDDVRPCEDRLNYEKFCFIISWKNLDQLGKNLLGFYNAKTIDELVEMQLLARSAYEKHLDFRVFSKNLFETKIPNIIQNI